jgi:plastocyanin
VESVDEEATPDAAVLEDGDSRTVSITVRGFAFPGEARVRAGTQVVWTNGDSDEHDVTAVDYRWGSPVLVVGASYARDFAEPGRYQYFCTIHPFMRGVLIVE